MIRQLVHTLLPTVQVLPFCFLTWTLPVPKEIGELCMPHALPFTAQSGQPQSGFTIIHKVRSEMGFLLCLPHLVMNVAWVSSPSFFLCFASKVPMTRYKRQAGATTKTQIARKRQLQVMAATRQAWWWVPADFIIRHVLTRGNCMSRSYIECRSSNFLISKKRISWTACSGCKEKEAHYHRLSIKK
jgi:hypothetical protein